MSAAASRRLRGAGPVRSGVLTVRGRAFVAAGATLVVAGMALGFRDLTRVGILVLGLPVLAAAVASARATTLSVRRDSTPIRVATPDPVTVVLSAENTGSRATPALMAQDILPAGLGPWPRFLVGRLAPGERCGVRYTLDVTVRGRHRLGPLQVEHRDPFGLTARTVLVGDPGELVVLPRIWPLGDTRPAGTGLGLEGEIPHLVAAHGEDDQSIREYRDGDDLRRIHWPATARTGDLMVRQEDRPARRRAAVVLDSRAEVHRGSGASGSFEWAVSAVASVVAHLAARRYAVHLVSAETLESGRAAERSTVEAALDGLAEAAARPGRGLGEVSRAAQTLTDDGGLLVAILVADRHDELQRVAAARQPGGTGLAILVDAASFADESRRSPNGGALDAAGDLFATAGWTVAPVSAGTTVASAWARVTAAAQAVR